MRISRVLRNSLGGALPLHSDWIYRKKINKYSTVVGYDGTSIKTKVFAWIGKEEDKAWFN